MGGKLSDYLLKSLKVLGVTTRYSIINDYHPHYLIGEAKRKLISNTSELGSRAIRKMSGFQ